MPTFTGRRGELTRSTEQVIEAGGLVPKLALNTHEGGFTGFIRCRNKTPGVLGCKCAKMDEEWMHHKAVAMMRAFALHPDYIVNHTKDNCVGLLSWAGPAGNPYAGQQTSYTTPEMDVYSYKKEDEALLAVYERLRIRGRPQFGAKMAFRLNNVEFAMSQDMSVLAMIVGENLEYSFFTPVRAEDIEFGGIDEGGLQAPEDPAERVVRMMGIPKGTSQYEERLRRVRERKALQAKIFIDIVAGAVSNY